MNKRKAANTGGGTIGCAICWRDEKKKVQYPKNTKGLAALIDHWKKIHPGRVTTSNGTPIEKMSMDWAK